MLGLLPLEGPLLETPLLIEPLCSALSIGVAVWLGLTGIGTMVKVWMGTRFRVDCIVTGPAGEDVTGEAAGAWPTGWLAP